MDAPCRGCDHRHPACHDTCAKYGTYRKWKNERAAKVQKERQIDYYALDRAREKRRNHR